VRGVQSPAFGRGRRGYMIGSRVDDRVASSAARHANSFSRWVQDKRATGHQARTQSRSGAAPGASVSVYAAA